MKRLIVYFHYDPLGQIDTACRVAVEAMAHYGEVFFISNSTLRPADRAWAASVTLTCRERENKGLDVGAYKEALAVIGRGRLARYDELVLMNFTLAGRVLRWSMLTPSKFSVMETVWFASHSPTSAAFCSTITACAAEEQTGFVLGIRFTKV